MTTQTGSIIGKRHALRVSQKITYLRCTNMTLISSNLRICQQYYELGKSKILALLQKIIKKV